MVNPVLASVSGVKYVLGKMGAFFSSFASAEEPPSVVLVPPMLDSRERGRSRFAKSSYDRLFAQPQLRILFGDFLHSDARGALRFSPPEDPRISVAAKLGIPRHLAVKRSTRGGVSATAAPSTDEATSAGITLRYQPEADVPWTFCDLKLKSQGSASAAALRGCYFEPGSRLALFGILPLVAQGGTGEGGGGGGAVSTRNLRVGVRYTSPGLSAGAIVNPAQSMLHTAWAVGRVGGLLWGVQTRPDLRVDPLMLRPGLAGGGWGEAAERCKDAASWAVAYRPEGQSAYGKGVFTAVVELRRRSELAVSFLHHLAVQRNVHNPLEASDVVGITNYLDVGFQMTTDLTPGGGGSASRLAAAWQVNKNLALKARLGLDGVAAALLFKSWWQPALTLGLAAGNDWRGGATRFGLTFTVEGYKGLRYERSQEGAKMAGARLTQRHVASDEDLAYSRGKGLMVPLSEVDNPAVLGQSTKAGEDFL